MPDWTRWAWGTGCDVVGTMCGLRVGVAPADLPPPTPLMPRQPPLSFPPLPSFFSSCPAWPLATSRSTSPPRTSPATRRAAPPCWARR